MLWKKLIERKVNTDSLWRGLAERREWIQFLFKPKPGESHRDHSFYRMLYPSIIKDIEVILVWKVIKSAKSFLHLYVKGVGGHFFLCLSHIDLQLPSPVFAEN